MFYFQAVALFFAIAISFMIFNQTVMEIPSFYGWDSTYTLPLRYLELSGGLFPPHLHYPNLTPLFFHKWFIIPLGNLLGFIHISNLNDFEKYTNPMLEFILFTRFTIVENFILGKLLGVLVLYILFLRLLKPVLNNPQHPTPLYTQAIIHLTFIAYCFFLILLKPAIYHDSSYNFRFETFGIVFGVASMLLAHFAATSTKRQWLLVMMAGLFFGFSFYTKINTIVILPLVFGFYYIYHSKNQQTLSEKQKKYTLLLSFYLFFFFTASTAITAYYIFSDKIFDSLFSNTNTSWRQGNPYQSWEQGKGYLPSLFIAFCFPLITLVIAHLAKQKPLFQTLFYYLHKALLFTAGFVSVLFISLFMDNRSQFFTIVYYFTFGLGFLNNSSVLNSNPFQLLPLLLYLLNSLLFLVLTFKDRRAQNVLISSLILMISYLLNTYSPRSFFALTEISLLLYIIQLLLYWNTLRIENTSSPQKWKQMLTHPLLVTLVFCCFLLNIFTRTSFKTNTQDNIVSGGEYNYVRSPWFFDYYDHGTSYSIRTQQIYNTPEKQMATVKWANDIFPLQSVMKVNILYSPNTKPHHIGETSLIYKGQAITPDGSKRITDSSTELQGSLLLPLNVDDNFHLTSQYDFYIATNDPINVKNFATTPLEKIFNNESKIIEKTNLSLSINNKKYTVYKAIFFDVPIGTDAFIILDLPKTKEKYLIIKK